jgi:hypothetical protein
VSYFQIQSKLLLSKRKILINISLHQINLKIFDLAQPYCEMSDHYWMASWREGGKTRNVHLGSARRMDAEAALQKARQMKAEAIHAN